MGGLPSGTVTLLFTDIEGSTRLLQELGRERYVEALTAHRRLLRRAFSDAGGFEVEMQGDSFHFSFASAHDAVRAAAAGQRALAAYDWPDEPIRVRIGLHTGEPLIADGLYAGLDVHRAARVMSVASGGQILVSQRTADLVAADLPDPFELRDLGEHRLKDLLEPQRLWQLAGDGLAQDFPPLKTLTRTNLPVAANPLLGRDRELADLLALLGNGARLVTVTGPGGTGKTRVALQAAAELADRYGDGVFWVPLAGLRDPDLVLPALAHTVGAADDLASYVGSRELLVLLDNFEHLIAAAAPLAGLLAAAPRLQLLVTSRSRLNLNGEYEYPVDPLGDEGATELFLERARQTGARLEPSATVRAICRRVDNLPLAVELAAGRVRLLGPEALLARLEQRLPLLTGGRREGDERHRALRATIEWSHDLLDEDARRLFARLAVFTGGWSLEAAEAICGADLDALAALAEASLVKPAGDGRFLMLETIREYALERLDASGDAPALKRAHATFYLDVAEGAAPELQGGPRQQIEFDRLEAEIANLRAALVFALTDDPGLLVRFTAALGYFWLVSGFATELRRWGDAAITGGAGTADARARILRFAGRAALTQGACDEARACFAEAAVLARSVGDDQSLANALRGLGDTATVEGDSEAARSYFEQARAAGETAGDPWTTAAIVSSLTNLALTEGRWEDAHTLARDSLARTRSVGDAAAAASSLVNAGLSALRLGRRAEARAALAEVATVDVIDREIVAAALEALAWLLATAGHAALAAECLGAAADTLDRLGTRRGAAEQAVRDEAVLQVEETLAPEELEAAMLRGSQLPLEAAFQRAVAALD